MGAVHAPQYANWHKEVQVPKDTLPEMPFGSLSASMAYEFRRAFVWHLDNYDATLADIHNATGVSRDVMNKLKSRENSTTSVENGILIASFYGKTISEFIAMQEATETSRTAALVALLRPEEQRLLQAQIRGLLAQRDS